METTPKIASFIAETGYSHIPNEVVRIAKNAVLDCLGVTIAGSKEPVAAIMAEHVKEMKAVEEAGVIGGGFRTSVDLSAWVNGTASHALDYDDTFASAAGFNFHPTVPILAAVLALGEKLDTSGRDLLTAYIVGIEVESRVGAAIGRYNSELGWHPTPVVGMMGAAAASAHILKLDVQHIQRALGIAGSFACGLLQNFGTMTKPLHAGNAAKNGAVAALLAMKGITANENIFEGESGYCSIFSGGKVKGVENKEQDLGKSWHIVSLGLSLKAYPCCRSTHSSIDACLYLRNVMGIDADHVAKIICKTSRRHPELARFHRPKSAYEGKFSIPYCIAVALRRGHVLLEDFTEEKVADPKIRTLLSKVDYLYPQEYQQDPMSLAQEIVVKLANGNEYAYRVDAPKGDPQNPMTDEELSAKFRDCARCLLSETKIENMLEMVNKLDSLDNISKLMELVTYTETSSRG